ncbi:MAG: prephenate dehydratase, partial [Lachnospiraceae bacterium]|nr:prephenate dehydratase [Lachnospiraceae bacterium]
VAEYKIANGKQVLDKKREAEKLQRLEQLAESEFSGKSIRELFEQIMAICRKRQYQLMAAQGRLEDTDFEVRENLDFSHAKVVYQGVEGAYSQMAMQAFFGEHPDAFHVGTWRDAMEAIKQGSADYAVLPIENSSAGIVSENYDLLVEYDNCIVGEQIIPIDHCLLGTKGSKLSDIEQVYSHPQALMQCGRYLDEHRSWEKHSFKNTAMAAKKVKEDGLTRQAAIASRLTADIYGLDILDEHIQDNSNNCTKFVIVTGRKIFLKDAGKISICFEIPHESGTLYHMLSHFIFNDLNMNKIESRPLGERNWEYRFFIDFEGNLNESAVKNALHGIKEEAENFKILGNY